MSKDKSLVIRIEGNSKSLTDEFKRVKSKTENLDKSLRAVAKGAAVGFAALSATIALSVKSFATFETGLLGVGKTANISGKELDAFGKEIQKMATKLPFATSGLLDIAQTAGQLGVTGTDNILLFTETIAKLGTASDLAGDEAATSLTRILNVTNENISTIGTFASVIVALGNKFAATESEIVRMTSEIARSTTIYNVSAAEAAALGTALRSVGVRAESGGSAVGRAFRAIDAAVRGGGEQLAALSEITGLTGDKLKQTFEKDAIGVFEKFTTGLGRVIDSNGDAVKELEKFGLKGDEILKVLPVLAKNSELFGKALSIAAKETANATALETEFEAQSKSLDNEAKKLGNTIKTIAQIFGGNYAPSVKKATAATTAFLSKFIKLSEESQSTAAKILGVGAATLGIIAGVSALGVSFLVLGAGMGALGIVGAPVIAAFLAIAAGTALVVTNFDSIVAVFKKATSSVGSLLITFNPLIGILAIFSPTVDKIVDSLLRFTDFIAFAQTVFTVFGSTISSVINSIKIGFNDLSISHKKVQLALAEALPGQAFKDFATKIKGEIGKIREENKNLIQSNKEAAKSFDQVYDSISAERVAEKEAEVRVARDEAAAKEAERKAVEEEAKREQATIDAGLEAERLLLAEEAKREAERAQRVIVAEEKAVAAEANRQIKLTELDLIQAQHNNADNVEITTLKQTLKKLQDLRNKGITAEQKAEFANADELRAARFRDAKEERVKNKKDADDQLKFKEDFNDATVSSAIGLGKSLVKQGSAAHKAILVIEKFSALKSIAIATWKAIAIAHSAALPPVNYALMAVAAAQGAIQVAGVMAATVGLEQGGLVGSPGASRKGDRIPAMLSDGELVVPRRNFDEVVTATAKQRGLDNFSDESGEGSTRVEVEIAFTDEAAEFITARQLENRTLGRYKGFSKKQFFV